MKNKSKKEGGPARQEREKAAKQKPVTAKQPKDRSINDDDIEADRHNGSAGAFEATERTWDDEG